MTVFIYDYRTGVTTYREYVRFGNEWKVVATGIARHA